MTTLEELQDLLVSEHKLSREQLKSDAQLNSLGIDSLGLIELMFQIEDRFKITLPDDKATFATIEDVVRYIDQLLVVQRVKESVEMPSAHSTT